MRIGKVKMTPELIEDALMPDSLTGIRIIGVEYVNESYGEWLNFELDNGTHYTITVNAFLDGMYFPESDKILEAEWDDELFCIVFTVESKYFDHVKLPYIIGAYLEEGDDFKLVWGDYES